MSLRISSARFFKSAAASVLAASVALTACSGGTSAIPHAPETARSTGATSRDGAVQCRAALPGGAICGSSAIRIPAGTEPSADGGIIATGTNDPIFLSVRTGRLLVRTAGVFHRFGGAARRTSVLPVVPNGPPGCPDTGCTIIMGATPGPLPAGAQMGSDGNAYDNQGSEMGWCSDCGANGNGAWIYYIGSTSTPPSVPYEGDMSPYLTASQFADNLAPWFYTFAFPIDIPIGGFLGRFGGRIAARIGTTRVGRIITLIKAAVPASKVVSETAYAVNAELAKIGYADPPFAVASQVLDVTVDASSVVSLNAEFVGDSELVRVTGSDQTLTGGFWTTKDAISDANGTLLSAQEIQNVLALNYTPTNIVYGGVIAPGSELYVGIVGAQEYAPEGGGVIQLFVKSGAITGARNDPIP